MITAEHRTYRCPSPTQFRINIACRSFKRYHIRMRSFFSLSNRRRAGDPKFSAPHEQFIKSNRCVNGHSSLFVRFCTVDGKWLYSSMPYSWMPPTAQAYCKRCEAKWPVFGEGSTVYEGSAEAGYESSTEAGELNVTATETLRFAEYIGDDEHIVDGRLSSIQTRTTIRASRSWRQALVVEVEETRMTSGGVNVSNLFPIGLQASLEATVRKSYNINVETDSTFEQEIELEVPPQTKLRVVLRWKKLWQAGMLTVKGGETSAQVPYKVAVAIAFDQILSTVDDGPAGRDH